MTIKKLYSLCANITMASRVCIMEQGRDPFESDFVDVYDDLCYRKIKWFSVEDGLIVIKLKRKV